MWRAVDNGPQSIHSVSSLKSEVGWGGVGLGGTGERVLSGVTLLSRRAIYSFVLGTCLDLYNLVMSELCCWKEEWQEYPSPVPPKP